MNIENLTCFVVPAVLIQVYPSSPLWHCRRPEISPCSWHCSRCSPASCTCRRRRSSDGWNVPHSCSTRLGASSVPYKQYGGAFLCVFVGLVKRIRQWWSIFKTHLDHKKDIHHEGLRWQTWQSRLSLLLLHVADATVMRPGWLWNDAFLAEGHWGNWSFFLE